ncbi:Uncharacterised protein [Bordetella pertussis]|nr:Uncharacterised protein [Bordetella pertussis]
MGLRPTKSNRSRSIRCEGTTRESALKTFHERPGCLRSHSWIIRPTSLRLRFSCEPHRLQGMMGNCLNCA